MNVNIDFTVYVRKFCCKNIFSIIVTVLKKRETKNVKKVTVAIYNYNLAIN